jgi:3-isopropylmalate/(R)-2-methylmalate dehydratase small subunit
MAVETIRRIDGTGLPLRGDNVDTDRIIPARFLKSITFEGLERHLFEDDRIQLEADGSAVHPVSSPAYAEAAIMLVNANFGCGSSREHAPQAIRRRGIRAVIGESFSEIFFGNSVALGMPCVTADRDVVEAVMAAVEADPTIGLSLDIERSTVRVSGRDLPIHLPAAARDSFVDGTWDATGMLLDRFEDVEAVAKRLPYLHWS